MTRALTALGVSVPENADPADDGTWGLSLEEFFDSVDRATGVEHDISTTGGTTTLTDAQNDCAQIFVTGTLASNAIIEVKARKRFWIIRNATSGAFTLTVRVAGGAGASVVINQSRSAIVHTDGADCYIIDLGTMSGTPPSVSGPVEYPDGSEGSPAVTNTGDTNTGLFFPAADSIGFSTAGAERLRIDANGDIIAGYKGAALTFGDSVVPRLSVLGTNAKAAAVVGRYSADALPAHMRLAKSRNATAGSHTIVQAADVLGALSFDGSDGTNFLPAVQLTAIVGGTPGTNDMPGTFILSTTADGAAVPSESLRVDPNAFLSLDGDTDTGFQNGGTNILDVFTAGTRALRWDASQRLLMGHTASFTGASSRQLKAQIGAAGGVAGLSIGAFSADSDGGYLSFFKSRSATVGTTTGPSASDTIGAITFEASDSGGSNKFTAAAIRGEVDAAVGLTELPGRLVFLTTPDGSNTLTERMRITNAGQLLQGYDTARASAAGGNAVTPVKQVHGNATGGNVGVFGYSATTSWGPAVVLSKSANGTVGGLTAVANNETLGILAFAGYDGGAYSEGATIRAEVDGTPGASDMPARLVFLTSPDGSATPAERMRITQAGVVSVGGGGSVTNHTGTALGFQVNRNSAAAGAQVSRFSADASGPLIIGLKSRSGTLGTLSAVNADDALLNIVGSGVDGGGNPQPAAAIVMLVDGTPGVADMPGRISLQVTPDGSNTLAEAVRIAQNKLVTAYGDLTVDNGATTLKKAGAGVLVVDKTDGDGQLVLLRSAGVTQGVISVSAGTITYGTFTGAHTSQLASGDTPDIPRGTVVEAIDDLAYWDEPTPNDYLPCFKVSDTPGSKAVYGVFLNWDEDGDAIIASLGTYKVRMAPGQTPQLGDYLESNGDGCARVQADDILRASTIAKVTSTTVAVTYPDGSFLIPCTLHCG